MSKLNIKKISDISGNFDTEYLIDGCLTKSSFACIFGASGVGKTFTALDIGFAISSGREWFGRRTKASKVLYCAIEAGRTIEKRIQAYIESGNHNELLESNFNYLTAPINFHTSENDYNVFIEILEKNDFNNGLIIIDTLNALIGGADENASYAMGSIIDKLRKIIEKTNNAVLIVHHSGKNESRGLRGHSSLYAALDTLIEVSTNSGNDSHVWKVEKQRDDARNQFGFFKLVPTFFSNLNGREVSSCVIDEIHNGHYDSRIKTAKATNIQVTIAAIIKFLNSRGNGNKEQLLEVQIKEDEIVEVIKDDFADQFTCSNKLRIASRVRDLLNQLIESSYLIKNNKGLLSITLLFASEHMKLTNN